MFGFDGLGSTLRRSGFDGRVIGLGNMIGLKDGRLPLSNCRVLVSFAFIGRPFGIIYLLPFLLLARVLLALLLVVVVVLL